MESVTLIVKFETFCRLLELYTETGESLGEGAFGHVRTYVNNETGKEYAVKVCLSNVYVSQNIGT